MTRISCMNCGGQTDVRGATLACATCYNALRAQLAAALDQRDEARDIMWRAVHKATTFSECSGAVRLVVEECRVYLKSIGKPAAHDGGESETK